MEVKKIRIENAVGTLLAHDMTRIIPGEFKGVGFRRNHKVRHEDIPELLKIGKKHLFALRFNEDELHEDDAALKIAAALCGPNLRWTEPREGKSEIISKIDGIIEINVPGLSKINHIGEMFVATLKTGMVCNSGQTIAATRIIPLVIGRDKIASMEAVCEMYHPILRVFPFVLKRAGLIVSGSEIYEGLIQDGSDKCVVSKLKAYGCKLVEKKVVSDDVDMIADAIRKLVAVGCEFIITTGGLSVDPDDVTRMGVLASGAEIISYGSPVLPGFMVLNARIGDVPILGLPACVFYEPRTVYDLLLPRLLADRLPNEDEIGDMGHGGLCMKCEVCHFPSCPFGR